MTYPPTQMSSEAENSPLGLHSNKQTRETINLNMFFSPAVTTISCSQIKLWLTSLQSKCKKKSIVYIDWLASMVDFSSCKNKLF